MGKRTKKIDARFTEEEYNLVLALEKELGISKTELVRLRVLDNARQVVVNAGLLIARLDDLGAELRRSGNNINQLARYANRLQLHGILSPVVAERYLILLEQYNGQQRELTVALRRIIRELGS